MSENAKTLICAVVAALFLAGAWAAAPRSPRDSDIDDVGQRFFKFDDPLAAASLEIIEYDEELGALRPFKVAKVKGVWSIPSKFDYPADAEKQLAEAAASVIDLTKLAVVSDNPVDHEIFGVVEPNPASLEPGMSGVGTRVTIEDETGNKLVQLIVGKEVPDFPGLRYVRIPGQNRVYQSALSTAKLSTRFEDWIEDDLLKLNAWDVREVIINDYSIDESSGQLVRGDVMQLAYDDTDSNWSLVGLQPDEELVTSKLNDLRNALDDLRIVDVRRKPAGLSRELKKVEGIELDQQALIDLARRGFYVTRDGELLSNDGEIMCGTKDGVEYVLRFGEIAAGTESGAGEERDEEGDEPALGQGSNRYLFVTARFIEDLIPKPEFEPLPGEQGPAEQPVPDAPEEPADDAATLDDELNDELDDELDDVDEPADGGPASDATGDEAADEPASEESAAEMDAERQRIERDNQRKRDEYEERIRKGREQVDELNARFADWYYVISDATYQKIHLTRADIVKPKGADDPDAAGAAHGGLGDLPAADDDTIRAFEELKSGLDE